MVKTDFMSLAANVITVPLLLRWTWRKEPQVSEPSGSGSVLTCTGMRVVRDGGNRPWIIEDDLDREREEVLGELAEAILRFGAEWARDAPEESLQLPDAPA